MNPPTNKSTIAAINPLLNVDKHCGKARLFNQITFFERAVNLTLTKCLFTICLTICLTINLTLGLVLNPVSSLNAQDHQAPASENKTSQNWQGILDVGAAKLTLNVEIKKEAKGYSAILQVVEQGNAEIPVDNVVMTKDKITLELDALKANFEGKLDKSGQRCQGTFTQHGSKFDLELKRVDSFDDQSAKLVEYWKGTLDYSGTEMEMGLKVFRMANGSLTAKFSSYTQGATDLPVEFEKEGDTYKMKFAAARLEYTGTLDESKEKLLGSIKQRGSENELVFTKAEFNEAPKLNRPQNPKKPFLYQSEEVTYTNTKQDIQLAGTLTLPPGDGPFPVAITISGSGPADRDESHFGHKPFLVVADHLARQGIAVLRFDDRGVGDSTGDRAGATSADFATDVEAGIDFLKNHSKIDATKIGLIGHSEGGLIAPMVAAERDDVHFIVLLAGPGVDGGVILKSQSTAMMKANGESEEKLEANRKVHDAILTHLKSNPKATHEEIAAAGEAFVKSASNEAARKLMEPSAKQLVAILKSDWVSYFVKHDPVKTIAKAKCHVLAMNGEKDLQVLCDLNLNPIERALREGSPASFKVVRLPNTNHMFQETDGSGTPSDYGKIEETISPKALNILSDWIKKVAN